MIAFLKGNSKIEARQPIDQVRTIMINYHL